MNNFIKIVVVGDGAIGKTCMLVSFCQKKFPEEYVPTVFDNFKTNMMYGNETVTVGLWDTAGQEDYDRLRPLSYPNTNVFLVAFSVINPTSLQNVKMKWQVELKKHSPNVPIVIVGTQCDLRRDPQIQQNVREGKMEILSKQDGEVCARHIDAKAYVECSAKTREGLNEVFDTCVKVHFEKQKQDELNKDKKKSTCALL
jgi:small GTP-binding protein